MRQYAMRDNLIAADNQQGRPMLSASLGTLRDYTPRSFGYSRESFSAILYPCGAGTIRVASFVSRTIRGTWLREFALDAIWPNTVPLMLSKSVYSNEFGMKLTSRELVANGSPVKHVTLTVCESRYCNAMVISAVGVAHRHHSLFIIKTGMAEVKRLQIISWTTLKLFAAPATLKNIGKNSTPLSSAKARYSPISRATVRGWQKCPTYALRSVITVCEKQFAGNGTDTSGVSTEMTGTLLTWMQDHAASGCIFIGPPGAAKSMVAKATGNSGGIPTIAFDLGAMKGSLVGESSARLRQGLKVVDAVSQSRSLFIGTCNSIGVLPPELRRRFNLGTFYFDLPTASERKAIWKVYLKKYKLKADVFPSDEGWTGAEIKTCCDIAWRLRMTLTQAADYIVPVSRSASDQIERLRDQANGKFISASYSGVYQKPREQSATGRKLEV